MADVQLNQCDALNLKKTKKKPTMHSEMVGISHGNRTKNQPRLQFHHFLPRPVDEIHCVSAPLKELVNMLRNDAVAYDNSSHSSRPPFGLNTGDGGCSLFSPFRSVSLYWEDTVEARDLNINVCNDINYDAIHYRNTGVQ